MANHVFVVLRCALYSLKKLLLRPKCLAVVFVVWLFLDVTYGGIRTVLSAQGQTLNALVLFTCMLSSTYPVAVVGIGLMLILSDAPFFDNAQTYVLLRAGKTRWLLGQLCYILIASALYLLTLLCLQHAVMWPHIHYGKDWGPAYDLLAKARDAGTLPISIDLISDVKILFTARRAFLLTVVLRWATFVTCALVIFVVNLSRRMKLGMITAVFIIMMDVAITYDMPYWLYRISISSMARLNILNFGYSPHMPNAYASIASLCGALLMMLALALTLGRRRELSGRTEHS